MADPVQLNRVFVNLIKNAYEAMDDQPNPHIRLAIRPDETGEFVLVDVIDNGCGITAEDLDKIWVTFHTNKGIKGHAGLGLPACRLILEQIGGHISVTSQPGQGSTFTVSLPVYRGGLAEVKGETNKGKVLLIDDNDSWRHFAMTTLEAAGYKVAVSGPAYQTGAYDQYHLIVLDDILAEGASFEILQAIKQAGAIAKTLVVSSNPRVERTKERMLLGIYNLIPKPYTRTALLSEVKTGLTAQH